MSTTKPTSQSKMRLRDKLRVIGPFGMIGLALGAVVGAAILAVLIGAILREIVPNGDGGNPAAFQQVLSSPGLWEAARNSAILILIPGTIALLIGSIFAWLVERTDARMGLFSTMMPVIPLFLPPIALSIGWIFLGDRKAGLINGVIKQFMSLFGVEMDGGPVNINSWLGLGFLYTLAFVPPVFLTVSAALRGMDSSLDEASRMSGASILTTLRKVTLPSVFPAITSAAMLVLIQGIGEFSFARTIGKSIGIPTITTYLVDLVIHYPIAYDKATALGLLMLLIVVPIFIVQSRILTSLRYNYRTGRASTVTSVSLRFWKWPARILMLLYLFAASVLPLFSLIIVALQPYWKPNIEWSTLSFKNYAKYLAPGQPASEALTNSLLMAVTAATIGITVAAILSATARKLEGRLGTFLKIMPRVPATFSHVVMAVAVLITFSRAPFNLYGTNAILILAYVMIYLPQGSISANDAMSQVPESYLDAAAISGSPPGRSFLKVSLPIMIPSLVVGWTLLFVLSMGDLTASAILAGSKNPAVGMFILNIADAGTFSQLASLASVIALISATVVTSIMVWSSIQSRRSQ